MGLILFFLFILIPIAELYVVIQVGQAIGVLPTLGLMVLSALVGAYLARSQGRLAWSRFTETMSSGRIPGREVMDGAMIILGGALLLTPGFITDVVGISLLLPPSRAAYRKLVKAIAARTPTGRPVFFVYDRFPGGGSRGAAGAGGAGARRPGPGPGPGPGQATGAGTTGAARPRPASRAYDVEGEAREIDDSEYVLEEPERDG